MDEVPDYVRRNREHWDGLAAEYVANAERSWAFAPGEETWGIWDIPEREIRILFGRSRRRKHRALDMSSTCKYVACMSRMIQIRNVPEELHRKLKARAALAGMSLSDYLRREVERVAERPTAEEIVRRLRSRRPVRPRVSPARAVREERDRR